MCIFARGQVAQGNRVPCTSFGWLARNGGMVTHKDLIISLGEIPIVDFRHLSRKVNQFHSLGRAVCSLVIELVSDISTVHILKWCLRRGIGGFPIGGKNQN